MLESFFFIMFLQVHSDSILFFGSLFHTFVLLYNSPTLMEAI